MTCCKLWVIEIKDVIVNSRWRPTRATFRTRQMARANQKHWTTGRYQSRVRCYAAQGETVR